VTPYDPDPLQVVEWHPGAQDRRRSLLSRLVGLVKGWLGR
jgi:hypothetical protein